MLERQRRRQSRRQKRGGLPRKSSSVGDPPPASPFPTGVDETAALMVAVEDLELASPHSTEPPPLPVDETARADAARQEIFTPQVIDHEPLPSLDAEVTCEGDEFAMLLGLTEPDPEPEVLMGESGDFIESALAHPSADLGATTLPFLDLSGFSEPGHPAGDTPLPSLSTAGGR